MNSTLWLISRKVGSFCYAIFFSRQNPSGVVINIPFVCTLNIAGQVLLLYDNMIILRQYALKHFRQF